MVLRPLRSLAHPEPFAGIIDRWLRDIEEQLQDPGCDRYELCRRTLLDLYYPDLGNYNDLVADPATSHTTRAALLGLDPHNVTLEPEYYQEIDTERYAVARIPHALRGGWSLFARTRPLRAPPHEQPWTDDRAPVELLTDRAYRSLRPKNAEL